MAVNESERTPIGALLVQMRKAKGMTQKQAGEASGVSPSLIALIESGDRNASPETVEAIAIGLNLSEAEQERLLAARSLTKRLARDVALAEGKPPAPLTPPADLTPDVIDLSGLSVEARAWVLGAVEALRNVTPSARTSGDGES